MDQSPQKLGKGMIAVAFIVALVLLSLFFDSVLKQQHNPNQQVETRYSEGYREVVLQRNRSGHYLAYGRINGVNVEFLLDTGATTVSIPEHIANRIGLQRGSPQLASTANGTITTYATRLNRISLGEITLNNTRASINPHMDTDEILLGMSFLRDIEFTQRGDTLILRQYL